LICATEGCRRKRAVTKKGKPYSYCRKCFNAYHKEWATPVEESVLQHVETWLSKVDEKIRRRIIRRLKAS
jgi:hypothetical protein